MKIINLTLLLIFAISLNKANAQFTTSRCDFNPILSSEVIPLELDATNHDQVQYNGAAMFYESSPGNVDLYVLYHNQSSGWQKKISHTFSLNKIKGRIVSGDFDNDGLEDDIAALYEIGYKNTQLVYWIRNQSNVYVSHTAWTSTGYDAKEANYKVVSGDFDNDGKNDDVAAFYDYGSNHTRVHRWSTDGNNNITYTKTWESTGYDANKIEGRVVSGDFDNDGNKDDIAAMYDYGNGASRIHVWKGFYTGFQYQGSQGYWSTTSGYDASKVKFRFVSGNFDRQTNWLGVLQPFSNDIAAMYDYGNGQTKIHVWTLSGSSFHYNNASSGWWGVSNGYYANNVNHRMVPATINNNNGNSNCGYADIAAFYDYGSQTDKYHTFVSKDTYGDATYFYYDHYSICSSKLSPLKGARTALDLNANNELAEKTELTIFPNPVSSSMLNVKLKNSNSSDGIVEIYTLTGMVIYRNNDINETTFTIDVSKMASGIYYLKYSDKETILTKKIIIN